MKKHCGELDFFHVNDHRFPSSYFTEALFLRKQLCLTWKPVWRAVSLYKRCATCNHCLTAACHSLKRPFYALRREHFKAIPDLACNPIRSQIIQAFFDRRCGPGGSTWLRPLLLCCSNVWELSPFSQKLPSERRRSGRGDQLRGVPGGHVPLQAPVAAHDRGAAWERQEGETEMCVSAEPSTCLPLSQFTSVRADSSVFVCLQFYSTCTTQTTMGW